MKRVGVVLVVLLVLVVFIGTVVFLAVQAMEPDVEFRTEKPVVTDIVKKTVATGALVPRNEVEIKSRVSGILSELFVEAGDSVESGDLIARIRVVPQPQALERAGSAVRSARLNLAEAKALLEQDEALYESNALPLYDLEQRRVEELRSAERDLLLVREGALQNAESVATDIRSTVEGMVLDVPVKIGESVTETNTFNAGTTIAFVADMSDMIFEGNVDESEVGRISEGMPLQITVGALDNAVLEGELEHIAPKGELVDGAVQFAIKARIQGKDGTFVRAGSSANADIVLDRRKQVLAIQEALLTFDKGKPFVEVEIGEQQFEKRPVELGLSDGILVEVKGGVSEGDRLKGRPKG